MRRPEPWERRQRPRIAFLRDHQRGIRESAEYLGRRPVGTMFIWLVIGIVLALPAGLHLISLNLSHVSGEWEGHTGMVVYLVPGTTDSDAEDLVAELRTRAGVEIADLTSASEALAFFRDAVGIAGSAAELGENPLPASIDVRMADEHLETERQALVEWLTSQEFVGEVFVEHEWLRRLAAIQNVVVRLVLAFAAMFSLTMVMVVGVTVRNAIETRLDEIEVLHSIGAPNRFMQLPFNYCGVFYGLGGGAASVLLIAVVLGWIRGPLAELSMSYGTELNLVGFDVDMIATLFVGGSFLGWLGAVFETRKRQRRLRMSE